MARRFTIEILMNLAKAIGANPSKYMGTRTNISFLGKGPTKNPLFQSRLAGLEGASGANLGSKDALISATEDAMGFASAGKLNSIQTEILGHNLSGINKILNPPVLPSASVTPIRSGIGGLRKSPQRVQEIMDDMAMIEDPASVGLKRFPKETHKFMGRPLKDKDFSEIDRMVMEGKIPDARGRTWNLKTPETRPFMGWTPSVVPKVNMPASKVDHQRIANQYDFDVKLIKGKDWIETLKVVDTIFKARGWNVPTPKAEGGLARILEV